MLQTGSPSVFSSPYLSEGLSEKQSLRTKDLSQINRSLHNLELSQVLLRILTARNKSKRTALKEV